MCFEPSRDVLPTTQAAESAFQESRDSDLCARFISRASPFDASLFEVTAAGQHCHFGKLVTLGEMLAPWGQPWGPWERPTGHFGARSGAFIDFGEIPGPYLESFSERGSKFDLLS